MCCKCKQETQFRAQSEFCDNTQTLFVSLWDPFFTIICNPLYTTHTTLLACISAARMKICCVPSCCIENSESFTDVTKKKIKMLCKRRRDFCTRSKMSFVTPHKHCSLVLWEEFARKRNPQVLMEMHRFA